MEATSSSSKSILGGLYTDELLQALYTCDLLTMEVHIEISKIKEFTRDFEDKRCALLMTVMGFINNWISFVYAYGV
ncbi:hypothetical protein L1887_28535 [Cichorium endivia]|nr:hypothetical protein L1887_28535 [Cichorium endivia]